MRRIVVTALVLAASACGRAGQVGTPATSPARDRTITTANQLLAAMHDRYAGKWYRNLTFVQKSAYLRDGAVSREETWYEAAIVPGRLRIDIGEPSKGNGALYRSDSVYFVQGGRIATRAAGRNVLLTLGFDVYGQPPERTFKQLSDERIDMSVLRTDTLYGKRMYVVGAQPADRTSNQFWVEADRLLLVRLIQSNADRTRSRDTRFERYVAHGGGWVAEHVRVLDRGQVVFREEYSNVRVNVTLDNGIFVPEKWSTAKHWFTP